MKDQVNKRSDILFNYPWVKSMTKALVFGSPARAPCFEVNKNSIENSRAFPMQALVLSDGRKLW